MTTDLENVIAAYKACALWASTDWEGRPLDEDFSAEDFSAASNAAIADECSEFWNRAHELGLVEGMNPEQFGHDFFLTRNHHGAGFWDRGLGARGDELTDMAHLYGSQDVVACDNGELEVTL